MYKASDKICELMSQEEDAIRIISRFGLEMGVGEQTIAEACAAHGVHTPTFLAVVNYKVFQQRAIPADIDLQTLQCYLHNAHTYFLDFRLPRLRRALIEAIIPVDPTTKIPGLITPISSLLSCPICGIQSKILRTIAPSRMRFCAPRSNCTRPPANSNSCLLPLPAKHFPNEKGMC